MADQRLFGLQRQERLLAALRRTGAVRVADLAREFAVSELTVRRDLAALAERHLLTRVHGGATLPAQLVAPARRQRRPADRFTLGMVVPSLDFYWPQIVTGARAAAAALGANLQLRGSSYDQAEDRRQIGRLIEAGQVHGLLLAPSLDADPNATTVDGGGVDGGGVDGGGVDGGGVDELLDWIGRLPVPTVLVERQPARWTPTPRQLEWVRTDHALGAELAVRHLAQQGHRRIGLVLSKGSPTSAELARGWRVACLALGLPAELMVRESVTLETPGHREIIAGLLGRCRRTGTTALIVHSDPDAISVAQYCAEQGMAIPGDLALVSYDDEVAHLAEPALTAVRPPKQHVGRTAVELLVSRLLDGDRRPSQRVLLTPELVVRESSLPRPGR